jgi:hypothetical protein
MKRLTLHLTDAHQPQGKTPAEEFAHYHQGDPPLLEDEHVGLYIYLEYRLKMHAEFDVSEEADYLNMPAGEIFELLERLEAVGLVSFPDKSTSDDVAARRVTRPLRIKVLPPLDEAELVEKRPAFLQRIEGGSQGASNRPGNQ